MGSARLNRPGLKEYLEENYGKVKNEEIAAKFFITPEYVRNYARRLGLAKTRPLSPMYSSANGIPAGYTKKDVVAETAVGLVLQKGNLRRHSLR